MATSSISAVHAIALRTIIDVQLLQFAGIHRRLRQQRNNLSPVCRLPPEILCMIFHLCINDTRRNVMGLATIHWYFFTHVCSLWRRIAIHNPALWNFITFDQPRWAQEMLRRSQMLPLTVHLTPSAYRRSSYDVVDTTLQCCRRISHLRLSTVKYTDLCRLTDQLKGPFPLMQSLEITITFQDIPTISVPNIFSDINFPTLATLTFSGCGFDWEGVLPSSLKTLSVSHDTNPWHTTRPHMQHIFNILRTIPMLSSLTLSWSLPVREEDSPGHNHDAGPPLQLGSLRFLRVVDKAVATASFISGIRIPLDATVQLECQTSSETSLTKLRDAIRQCGLVTGTRVIRYLTVDQASTNHMHFITSTALRDNPSELCIDISWMHWGDQSDEITLLMICSLFDMSDLAGLYVVDIGHIDRDVWRTAFSSAHQLCSIRVRGEPTHGLLQALDHEFMERPASECFLPNLHTLVLEKVRFHIKETKDIFVQCLTARRNLGIGLHAVDIYESSGFGADDLSLLRTLAPKSSWDAEILANVASSDDDTESHEGFDGYGSEYWSEDYDRD